MARRKTKPDAHKLLAQQYVMLGQLARRVDWIELSQRLAVLERPRTDKRINELHEAVAACIEAINILATPRRVRVWRAIAAKVRAFFVLSFDEREDKYNATHPMTKGK